MRDLKACPLASPMPRSPLPVDNDLTRKADDPNRTIGTVNGSPRANAEKPGSRRRVFPVHPFLFACFPIISLYAENRNEIPVLELAIPLLGSVFAALVCWAVFFIITRHNRKSALFASVLILLFFSYQHVLNMLPSAMHILVGPMLAVTLCAIGIGLIRLRTPFLDATAVSNCASIVLFIPPLWSAGTSVLFGAGPPGTAPKHRGSTSLQSGIIDKRPNRHRTVSGNVNG